MTEVTKKWLTIAGGIAISGGLMILIANQITPEKSKDKLLENAPTENNQLVVSKPEGEGENSTEDLENNLFIPPIGENSNESTLETPEIIHPDSNISIPEAGTMNGNDQGTSQTIQPDVPQKPTYTQDQLSDPTQTPSGGTVTQTENGSVPVETPEPGPPTVTVQPEITPAPEVIPDSQITGQEGEGKYVEGFGWVPYGGENVTTQATDMYQNGNKVGIM